MNYAQYALDRDQIAVVKNDERRNERLLDKTIWPQLNRDMNITYLFRACHHTRLEEIYTQINECVSASVCLIALGSRIA